MTERSSGNTHFALTRDPLDICRPSFRQSHSLTPLRTHMRCFLHALSTPPCSHRTLATDQDQQLIPIFPHYFQSYIGHPPPVVVLLFSLSFPSHRYRYIHLSQCTTTDDGSNHDNSKPSNGCSPEHNSSEPGDTRQDERDAELCVGDIVRVSGSGFDYRGDSDGREVGV